MVAPLSRPRGQHDAQPTASTDTRERGPRRRAALLADRVWSQRRQQVKQREARTLTRVRNRVGKRHGDVGGFVSSRASPCRPGTKETPTMNRTAIEYLRDDFRDTSRKFGALSARFVKQEADGVVYPFEHRGFHCFDGLSAAYFLSDPGTDAVFRPYWLLCEKACGIVLEPQVEANPIVAWTGHLVQLASPVKWSWAKANDESGQQHTSVSFENWTLIRNASMPWIPDSPPGWYADLTDVFFESAIQLDGMLANLQAKQEIATPTNQTEIVSGHLTSSEIAKRLDADPKKVQKTLSKLLADNAVLQDMRTEVTRVGPRGHRHVYHPDIVPLVAAAMKRNANAARELDSGT
jgi:hypothetical protein